MCELKVFGNVGMHPLISQRPPFRCIGLRNLLFTEVHPIARVFVSRQERVLSNTLIQLPRREVFCYEVKRNRNGIRGIFDFPHPDTLLLRPVTPDNNETLLYKYFALIV